MPISLKRSNNCQSRTTVSPAVRTTPYRGSTPVSAGRSAEQAARIATQLVAVRITQIGAATIFDTGAGPWSPGIRTAVCEARGVPGIDRVIVRGDQQDRSTIGMRGRFAVGGRADDK